MAVSEIENTIELCQQHIMNTNTKGSEIETFLTRFLLIHVSGEYDKEIKKMIVERAKKSGDIEITSFIEQTVEKIRNPKISDIRGLLKKFSKNYAVTFTNNINPELEGLYQNIIINRNSSAHGDSINMTIEELMTSHKKAINVLKFMSDSLNL